MKAAVLVVVCCASVAPVEAGQAKSARRAMALQAAVAASAQPDPQRIGDAYEQFLIARHLEAGDNIEGAIAAYRRAIEFDPTAADIPAELAALYMRQSRAPEAIAAAEQALKVAPANREAHRVLGIVYAALADNASSGPGAQRPQAAQVDENARKAIGHLEKAIEYPVGEPDPNVRATLARLYLRSEQFGKAIPLLSELVFQESGWTEGPALLAAAYAGAGRSDDAIKWLEEAAPSNSQLYPTLADFYERERRWRDAARAYESALKAMPRGGELKTRYASALLNAGGRENATKARDVLTELLAGRSNDARALYLLSQAERRLGDTKAAEQTARQVIAQNARSPWGYYALVETLEERREYQAVIDLLTPVAADFRARGGADGFELGLLLPHLGFAYQERGDLDKAIATFDEAHKVAPKDAAVIGYLAQAYIAARRYPAALDLIRRARAERPDDQRLARLEAQALQKSGKADQAISLLSESVRKHPDDPMGYVALAQVYTDANRGGDAVKLLRDAQGKFPDSRSIEFSLGAAFDKDKKFADAESVFQKIIAQEPDNAAALNYLGYMLADRGERLEESVAYLKKALALEPDNGSFLDSLGWAYFKASKLDLAEENLKRAADRLQTNSVVQDHYGDLLFRLGRYDAAIGAWTRALGGDGDSIERGSIEKKVRAAKQKLGQK